MINATLTINGTLEEKVVFEGDRLEHDYHNIPGQWGTIWMREGSKNNIINHTIIKNGTIGIRVDDTENSFNQPTLTLQNTEIYNNTNFGLLSRGANIDAYNNVIGSAGSSSFFGTLGGTYNFTHTTFANYWNDIRLSPTVSISNFSTSIDENGDGNTEIRNLNEANFLNCIIEGNNNTEFLLNREESTNTFNYNISNCLIKFRDPNDSFSNNLELNFEDTTHYQNNILNGNPDFKDTTLNLFSIGENNDGINKASNSSFILDILEIDRSTSPDIGAYQHIIFEETEE